MNVSMYCPCCKSIQSIHVIRPNNMRIGGLRCSKCGHSIILPSSESNIIVAGLKLGAAWTKQQEVAAPVPVPSPYGSFMAPCPYCSPDKEVAIERVDSPTVTALGMRCSICGHYSYLEDPSSGCLKTEALQEETWKSLPKVSSPTLMQSEIDFGIPMKSIKSLPLEFISDCICGKSQRIISYEDDSDGVTTTRVAGVMCTSCGKALKYPGKGGDPLIKVFRDLVAEWRLMIAVDKN